jgi:hypothetical protein
MVEFSNMFASKSFRVLGVPFKLLLHFELTFVYGVKKMMQNLSSNKFGEEINDISILQSIGIISEVIKYIYLYINKLRLYGVVLLPVVTTNR